MEIILLSTIGSGRSGWGGDISRISTIVVHEAEHSSQFVNLPELYAPQLDAVDRFAAMKLRELGARAADTHHTINLIRYRNDMVKFAELLGESGIKMSSEQKGRYVIDGHDTGYIDKLEKPLSFPDMLQLSAKNINWPSYEHQFYGLEMMAVLRSGQFEERVASSQFLHPAFLQRFCVDPNGNGYLPKDPQPLFDWIRTEVATLHEPFLAGVARDAKASLENADAANAPDAKGAYLRLVDNNGPRSLRLRM